MHWSKDGNALGSLSVIIYIPDDVQQLTSVINFQIKADDNEALITCKSLFTETIEHLSKTSATNVPEYVFYWNTTLNVFCK